ncbi:tRNA pseudouridine(38-40) synthase TruA [Geosporobacter ferrireducens]|uniref:tRNA pseudouridine synthase A n=1 Tax=Geosporobacter ferrireducens TaxID=1424294 RepID=A0A1D8GJW5_9FIRM|nr:tRNA pseudouridine(38-40) synthase TruA [Geosporobacter ferrireducens]AOT71201.1 tRNA pseudouridine(38-40) synthase TruA [Geosporobacter ferrireducens]MTI58014.1 tRNA pseudouridine(38-40) synthase TruA [Geosporobacter ferrireducens]
MRNIKLLIEYDGTNFCGWQRQNNGRTIQEEIEKALEKVLKRPVKIHGSGRTDTGVHALGQVASFKANITVPMDKIPLALNSLLPEDISVKGASEVEEDFHARYSAKGKKYIYQIYNGPLRSPLLRNYAYFVAHPLDLNRMQEAAQYFLGSHDFKGFMASGSCVQDTVRTLYKLDVYFHENLIKIEVEGNGFLYNMVRIISGTLVEVGKEKILPTEMQKIIASGIRESAGPTAPAQGLYLAEVFY